MPIRNSLIHHSLSPLYGRWTFVPYGHLCSLAIWCRLFQRAKYFFVHDTASGDI